MRRRNGFTLIEMVIAIVILMVILLLAVPSVTGVLADRRLRRSFDDMNRLVRQAQEFSIVERRPYLIVWRDKQFALRPEGFLKGESRSPIATVKFSKGESYTTLLPKRDRGGPAVGMDILVIRKLRAGRGQVSWVQWHLDGKILRPDSTTGTTKLCCTLDGWHEPSPSTRCSSA